MKIKLCNELPDVNYWTNKEYSNPRVRCGFMESTKMSPLLQTCANFTKCTERCEPFEFAAQIIPCEKLAFCRREEEGLKELKTGSFMVQQTFFFKLYLNKLHDSCDYQLICPEIPQCFLSRTLPYFHKFEVCHRALEWFHADDPRGQVITQVYEWENSQKLWSVNELNVSFTAGFSLLIIQLLSKYMSFISNVTSLSGDSTCLSRF